MAFCVCQLGQETTAVLGGRWFQAPFRDFCSSAVPELLPAMSIHKFSPGQSNPTFLLDDGKRRVVVRMKPSTVTIPGTHAVDREFRVLSALHKTGFPVPKPFALCMDDDVLGAPFYIMEFVAGRVFFDPALPSLSPSERVAVIESALATMDQLHAINIDAVGLTDFGKHTNYYGR